MQRVWVPIRHTAAPGLLHGAGGFFLPSYTEHVAPKCVLAGAAVAVGLVAIYVWLGLWADDRNQRFYMANEPRNWVG